jgi:hypothetical protein
LTIISALAQTSSAVARSRAPAFWYVFVAEPAAESRALLDVDRVTRAHEQLRAGGNEGDTVLVGLDFLRDADDHLALLSRSGSVPFRDRVIQRFSEYDRRIPES